MIYGERPFLFYRAFYWTKIWKTPPNAKLYHQYLSVSMEELKLVCLRDWTESPLAIYLSIHVHMFTFGRCFWGRGVTWWICKWCLFNWLITRTVHLSPHSNPLSVVSFQISLIALHRARNNVYKEMFVEWTCLACLNLEHRCACILRACLWLYRQREGMRPIYMTLIKI